jgi:uncharacterized protein (DUF302 family)
MCTDLCLENLYVQAACQCSGLESQGSGNQERRTLPENAQHWPLVPSCGAPEAAFGPVAGARAAVIGGGGGWFQDCTRQIEARQDMEKRPPLLTFTIAEPYDVALRRVRTALARQGLRAPAELDITARIRQELGAGVAPCIVLYVDDPAVLLEAVVFYRGAALLIPQPLVITGDNRHTEVVMRSSELLKGEVPESVRDPLLDLQRRMAGAMESIAERQGAHLAVNS